MTIEVYTLDRQSVERGDVMKVALTVSLAGYKTVGGGPQSEEDRLAFMPHNKTVRAYTPGAPLYVDGTEAKIIPLDSDALIDKLIKSIANEYAGAVLNPAADAADALTGASLAAAFGGGGMKVKEILRREIKPGEEDQHEHRMTLQNGEARVEFCVGCARKMVLGEEPVAEGWKDDKMIRLLLGTILNNEGFLFPET